MLGFCILCNNICRLELNLLKMVNMSIEKHIKITCLPSFPVNMKKRSVQYTCKRTISSNKHQRFNDCMLCVMSKAVFRIFEEKGMDKPCS